VQVDAFLADHVVVVEGKIYGNGIGWDNAALLAMPGSLRVGLGLIIRVPWGATNRAHKLEVFLETEDGQPVVLGEIAPGMPSPTGERTITRVAGQFNVGRPAHLTDGDEQTMTLAMMLEPQFLVPGKHAVVIEIDGTEMERLPLRINLAQVMVPGGPPTAA